MNEGGCWPRSTFSLDRLRSLPAGISLLIPCSLLRRRAYFGVTRISKGTSAKMSCQERDTSLFFSLLLTGEGFADDCALPRCLGFPARPCSTFTWMNKGAQGYPGSDATVASNEGSSANRESSRHGQVMCLPRSRKPSHI